MAKSKKEEDPRIEKLNDLLLAMATNIYKIRQTLPQHFDKPAFTELHRLEKEAHRKFEDLVKHKRKRRNTHRRKHPILEAFESESEFSSSVASPNVKKEKSTSSERQVKKERSTSSEDTVKSKFEALKIKKESSSPALTIKKEKSSSKSHRRYSDSPTEYSSSESQSSSESNEPKSSKPRLQRSFSRYDRMSQLIDWHNQAIEAEDFDRADEFRNEWHILEDEQNE